MHQVWISIHAPREGGDSASRSLYTPSAIFQSTPPARGATPTVPDADDDSDISIHAPREGGDHSILRLLNDRPNISIHAPREGGDHSILRLLNDRPNISIHAPREGGDQKQHTQEQHTSNNFNPRPPRGGRRPGPSQPGRPQDFNPRPPRGGRLYRYGLYTLVPCNFNPRPPRGGRLRFAAAIAAATT